MGRPVVAFLAPLKSPTWTSTQVTAVDQVVHNVVVKEVPLDRPTNHWPPCSQRAVISDRPSPLKSPTWASTQVTPGFQVAHNEVVKPLTPLLSPTHHWPPCKY